MLCYRRLEMQQRAAVGGHFFLHSDCLHFLQRRSGLYQAALLLVWKALVQSRGEQRSPNLHLDALQFFWKALECYKFGEHIIVVSSIVTGCCRAARSGQRITESQCLRILDHHLVRMIRTLAKCGTVIALFGKGQTAPNATAGPRCQAKRWMVGLFFRCFVSGSPGDLIVSGGSETECHTAGQGCYLPVRPSSCPDLKNPDGHWKGREYCVEPQRAIVACIRSECVCRWSWLCWTCCRWGAGDMSHGSGQCSVCLVAAQPRWCTPA